MRKIFCDLTRTIFFIKPLYTFTILDAFLAQGQKQQVSSQFVGCGVPHIFLGTSGPYAVGFWQTDAVGTLGKAKSLQTLGC